MSIQFKSLLFLTACALSTAVDASTACSSISIDRSAGNDRFYELHANNYLRVGYINSPKPFVLKQSESIELESGEHTLVFRQWSPVEYTRVAKEKRSREILKKLPIYEFTIDLKAGEHYQLAMNDNNQVSISKLTARQAACIEPKQRFLPAKNNDVVSNKLPSPLIYSLYETMYELKNNNQNIERGVIPLSVQDYFGAIIDNQYERKDQMRVLAVTPFSLASDMGLQAGDLISSLGKQRVSDSNEKPSLILAKYIAGQSYGAELSFGIIRHGEASYIKGNYAPAVMPELKFNFVKGRSSQVFNRTNVDPVVQKKLSHLLIELSLISSQRDSGVLSLNLPAIEDPKYGINGEMIRHDKQYGFLVTQVSNNSPAMKLGIKRGDVIIALNNHALNSDDINRFAGDIHKLKNGEPYAMKVVRQSKELTLSGELERRILPYTAINIDVAVQKRMSQYLASIKNHRVEGREFDGSDDWKIGLPKDKSTIRTLKDAQYLYIDVDGYLQSQ